MNGLRKLNTNPAAQRVENFMHAANASAEQNRQRGEKYSFVSAANAMETFKKFLKLSIAMANPASEKHNAAFNALRTEFDHDRVGIDSMHEIGSRYLSDSLRIAEVFAKTGMPHERAIESAFNSIAGNPSYDHFGNIGLLGGQQYENLALVKTWLDAGDAYSVPIENGGTGTDKLRFRAPVEQVVGSAKTYQGDINPKGHLQDDANRIQINLFNEFKNAQTIYALFSIDQDIRNQALGYAKAVDPALAGFILQNRYFGATEQKVMQLAELRFAFGQDAAGSYIPNVGGSYGLLSSSIMLQLADAGSDNPAVAKSSDWSANPTKLIQKILNKNYAMGGAAAGPLTSSIDPSLMYKDIVRLFAMAATQNINFAPEKWVLFVPTSWYTVAMQYPGTQSGTGQGTFNKQLDEMVRTATNGVVNRVEIVPSGLMNYGATNNAGQTNSYNYMAAVAMGCRQENKPIIMPGQTAAPVVTAESVSAAIMNFRTQYIFGGPMVMHYGGAFLMEFSV